MAPESTSVADRILENQLTDHMPPMLGMARAMIPDLSAILGYELEILEIILLSLLWSLRREAGPMKL